MGQTHCFFSELDKLIKFHNIINISGEGGTGKTTLALHLASNYITQKHLFGSQCMWVQASEFFPARRLTQLFDKNLDNLRFLRANIYITPLKRPFLSFEEQSRFFSNFTTLNLPPDLSIIIIDNISHHLRYFLSKYPNVTDKVRLLNCFYEEQLLPLIFFSQQQKIILILIHEVTYNPKLDKVVPFFNTLYSRIKSIKLVLERRINSTQKFLRLQYLEHQKRISYKIQNDGFHWISNI